MAEAITDATRKKGRAGRTQASSAARLHPSKECATHGPLSGQARHGTLCREFPMLRIGEKPGAVNRPRSPFWPRRKVLTGRMLLFGGVFWPFGVLWQGQEALLR
jgi:hypothetical protein